MGRQAVGLTPASRDVLQTLGSLAREARTQGRATIEMIAVRAGVSSRTVSAVESGSPTTSVGNVVKVLLAVGVPLFGTEDAGEYARMRSRSQERNALLPQRIRPRGDERDDDADLWG